MSNRDSTFYKEIKINIHIYRNMDDGKYHLEIDFGNQNKPFINITLWYYWMNKKFIKAKKEWQSELGKDFRK